MAHRGTRRAARTLATLGVTALCVWYIASKIDLGATRRIVADTQISLLCLAFAILIAATVPLAWRWQRLLAARGIEEPLPRLVRAYVIAYFLGQVLPTSLGGDAVRVYDTNRRHRGETATITASVVLERVLGGAATLALAAAGFLLAVGSYDVGAYLWIELAFLLGTILLGALLFARSARPLLGRAAPLLRLARVERPLRSAYEGVHAYRRDARLLLWSFALTLVVQAVRVLAIWLCGRAVGVDLSPRPYYVLGPLLFVVMLVPFTLNGLAVRESFFVSFLTQLGVGPEQAFATGFLYFLVSVALAAPGALLLAWESLPLGRRTTTSPSLQ